MKKDRCTGCPFFRHGECAVGLCLFPVNAMDRMDELEKEKQIDEDNERLEKEFETLLGLT